MSSRADALAVGMLAGILWTAPASRLWLNRNIHSLYWTAGLFFVGFGLIGWFAATAESCGVASFGFSWIAIFYGLLVLIVLAGSEGWIARAMRTGWLRAAGRVSYCMYVIHLVTDLFFHSVFLHAPPQIGTLPGAGISLFAAIATYTLAWIHGECLKAR